MISWQFVKDINYSFFNFSNIDQLIAINYFGRPGISRQILIYMTRFFSKCAVESLRFHRLFFFFNNRVVLLSVAPNNWEALEGVSKYLPKSVNVSTVALPHSIKLIPFSMSYFFGIFFLPSLFWWHYKSGARERRIIRISAATILLSCGYYMWSRFLFFLSQPSGIVVANDHVFETRVLLHLAKRRGIPTFYIQHASVTEDFPPLMFTISFLDGKYSESCYKNSNESKCVLSGNLKFEDFREKVNKKTDITTIGIATNNYFMVQDVRDLVDILHVDFPHIRLVARPHPEEGVVKYRKFVEYSDPNSEPTFQFLSKIDLLISANSGIILEAALLNIETCTYRSLLKEKARDIDAYFMTRNSMYKTFTDRDTLMQYIQLHLKDRPAGPKNIGYYYSNAFQPIDKEPKQYIAKLISEYVQG